MKLLIKQDNYIQSNVIGRSKAHKMGSPFENLRSLTKQILQFLSQTKKYNVNQLLLPKQTPATLEIFHIANLFQKQRFSCQFHHIIPIICNTTSALPWTLVRTKPWYFLRMGELIQILTQQDLMRWLKSKVEIVPQ